MFAQSVVAPRIIIKIGSEGDGKTKEEDIYNDMSGSSSSKCNSTIFTCDANGGAASHDAKIVAAVEGIIIVLYSELSGPYKEAPMKRTHF
ncbi:hypothetical protein GEMRC1_012265 [Eukaryota sp. GEM-RC1]